MDDAPARKTYYGVQILRGLAALLVVMLHITLMIRGRLDPSAPLFYAGNAGVDIFFAISGFMMVIATARYWKKPHSALPFLRRRIIRIVPLYWLITLTEILALLWAPSAMRHAALLPWNTVASFLFIPSWNAEHHIHPVVDAGWTLSFEMLFYGLFALALALRVLPVVWLTVIFLIMSALSTLRTDEWPAPASLIDPMLLEFVFGMLVGQAALVSRRLPYPVAIALAFLMLPVLIITNFLPGDWYLAHRHIIWGVPGALMLWAIVSLEERWSALFRKMALLCLLGDASYAIYLSHDLVLIACFSWLASHPDSPLAISFILPLCLLLSCLAGIVIHLGIERPLLKWRHVAFRHVPAPPADIA